MKEEEESFADEIPMVEIDKKLAIDQLMEKNTIFKEIFIRKQPEDWNEININTGGIASTLQDIKTQQRSGGYVYKGLHNRFLSWRSESNVLEISEHSLDVNLHGNQVRYVFADSPVLDGVTISESVEHVILLVPTISSLHRFTYPHPDKLYAKGFGEPSAHSILHGVNETDSTDPRTFYIPNTPPSPIICATSCVAPNNDAIFAMSLANSSIIVIELESSTGKANILTFTQESLVPRFFSGITEVLLKKEVSENVSVSLLLHYFNHELFLFSLDRQGLLKAWSCERGAAVSSILLINKHVLGMIKSQKHKMFKGMYNDKFVIHCCIQGLYIYSVSPVPQNGEFHFYTECETKTPPNFELVNLCASQGNDIWCNWLSDLETPAVTRVRLGENDWTKVQHARPATEVKSTKLLIRDQASQYLDAIFDSGFFTSSDITKALTLYKTTAVIKPNIDIREQICAVVEAEIYSEVGEQDIYDDDFQDINQRCWSRLYSCCSQYITSAMLPLSLIWLEDTLVMIHQAGFSLVRNMENLELFWKGAGSTIKNPDVPYGALLESARKVDLDEAIEWIDLGLHLGQPVEIYVQKAASVANTETEEFENALEVFMLPNIEDALINLFNDLSLPVDYIKQEDDWKSYCSHTGISAVTSGLREFCSVRLGICKKILILLELLDDKLSIIRYYNLKMKATEILSKNAKMYYALYWACSTNVTMDTPLILSYTSAHYGNIMCNEFEDSVLTLLNTIWPCEGNDVLAQHLLGLKNYLLVETFSRLVNSKSRRLILAEAYLGMGEFVKGYETCIGGKDADLAYFLKCIRLFETYQRSDLAIDISKKALEQNPNISQSDLETLHSVLFIHELQLNHFSSAYAWMDVCSDKSRKTAFLQRLVSSMMTSGHLKELIAFPYLSMAKELDILLWKRAKRVQFAQAINYYNLLYAFHIKHSNYKSAATVMFEKGMRSDTCEMQWRCFGGCLNSLMLLDPNDAWILKPNLTGSTEEDYVEILQVDDIRREFELAGAKYNLGNCPPDAGEEEVIALCISVHEYRIAMRIANICKRPFGTVIQSFTAECANITNTKDWHWLKQNELDDITVNEKNYEEVCWYILRRFIFRYEKPKETELHKAAANQLLEMGMYIPCWLTTSYNKRNVAELLRLYIRHGQLIEAADLATDYLKAGMGIGYESYSMPKPLLPTSAPLYVPVHTIDLLLAELSSNKVQHELESTLKRYLDMAMRISEDKRIAFAI